MIGFVCCDCGAELQIDDEWSGKLGRCPHCRATTRLPGSVKRTSKRVILARFLAWPVVVLSFWTVFLGWPIFLGGMIAVGLGLFFCWAFTNIGTFLCSPHYYRLWKAGGGDPWFDTLDSPLNSDPLSVRFQELYREKARQECEQVDRQFGVGPAPTPSLPDATFGIDDPHII